MTAELSVGKVDILPGHLEPPTLFLLDELIHNEQSTISSESSFVSSSA